MRHQKKAYSMCSKAATKTNTKWSSKKRLVLKLQTLMHKKIFRKANDGTMHPCCCVVAGGTSICLQPNAKAFSKPPKLSSPHISNSQIKSLNQAFLWFCDKSFNVVQRKGEYRYLNVHRELWFIGN